MDVRELRERVEDNLVFVNLALVVALLVFAAVLLVGTWDSRASIDDVAARVTEAMDLTGMSSADGRTLRRLYGLNAADYQGVVLYTGDSNMDAQELLIIKLDGKGQADAVSLAMKDRVDRQLQSFQGYGADQTKLLQGSIIDARGNYAMLVVNAQAAQADQAFRDSL